AEMRVVEERYAAIPAEIREDLRTALAQPADKRTELQKYLADKLGPRIRVAAEEIEKSFDDVARKRMAELQAEISTAQAKKRTYSKLQAIWDVAAPPPAFVYRRGDFRLPGEPIRAGVVACMIPVNESPSFEDRS